MSLHHYLYYSRPLQSRGYVHIDTPMVTMNDCEGAGEAFSIATTSSTGEEFFDKKNVYLSVSGQLHLEAMEHMTCLRCIAEGPPFPRVPYAEALQLLIDKEQKVTGRGFTKQNESFLVNYHNSPIFITHFPVDQKPFYMRRSADEKVTESFDLLCPVVGELAGGSIREPSLDALQKRSPNIDWYLELRERGKPISGGFGLGFERLLQFLLGVPNIKDTIPFPRWYKHCQC
ncbi:tRNA ligase class II [Teladorsagia circumcincta]|uniref:tRNA ligase class II n=1 Tax=Teladorsagia circumcincta TaxID=45464 RepID=A0A2G9UW44_TELCI|nr:tRNA ligase class II [Teladorsagia circumcincta]